MDTFEYMRIPTKLIPHEIIVQYNLLPLVSDGHVYIEVQKGMYGLTEAGILVNQLLARRLASPSMAITKHHLYRASDGISLAQSNSP
jgi:hypothetical protein